MQAWSALRQCVRVCSPANRAILEKKKSSGAESQSLAIDCESSPKTWGKTPIHLEWLIDALLLSTTFHSHYWFIKDETISKGQLMHFKRSVSPQMFRHFKDVPEFVFIEVKISQGIFIEIHLLLIFHKVLGSVLLKVWTLGKIPLVEIPGYFWSLCKSWWNLNF